MRVITKLDKIKSMKSEENKRYELYAIFSVLIIEKQHFKSNPDLKKFIYSLGFDFKEYIMKSRPMILSKVLKTISLSKNEEIIQYSNKIYDAIKGLKSEEEVIKNKKTRKNGEENYIEELLQKFSRNK
ncbi:hypothetical protein [Leptotrichia sp. oral taxon 879]|uniref:hypothetical protein n=1 Tax=Leptotrichia sp. oral taxon 879 TaxID=1227267 RepID=UPI0003AE091E|nr:hypothetical protein [Leptotrichia sp. oral taxon 879]ERK52436.1 hypothetical protein HMPREF1552_00761 [Leptotrichia sp. oral taxon 879 str. F0557]